MAKHNVGNAFLKGYGLSPAKPKPAFPIAKRVARIVCEHGFYWHTEGDGKWVRINGTPNAMFAKMA